MNGGSVCSPQPLCPRFSKLTTIFFIQYQKMTMVNLGNSWLNIWLHERTPYMLSNALRLCSRFQWPEILIRNCVRAYKNRTWQCIAKKILETIDTNHCTREKIRISTLGSIFVFLHLSTPNCELLLKFPNPFLMSPSFAKKRDFIWGTKILKTTTKPKSCW